MRVARAQKALAYAFPITVPIGISCMALGLALGLFGVSQGLPPWIPLLMAATIFAGAMEFLTVGLLLAPFDPLGAAILALMVNGRHIFYGLSILDKYNKTGWKKWFLIAGLIDESFAINVSTELPEDVDRPWFYLHISWLLYVYWIVSVGLGAFAGSLLAGVNLQGIEFVLATLFLVIFFDMMRKNRHNGRFAFGLLGLLASVLCLGLLGPKSFALPSILVIIVYSFVRYKRGGVTLD